MSKKKQPAQPPPPYEAPNTLFSQQQIKILDLVGEGQIKGFVVQSGVYGSDPLTSVFYNDLRVRNLDGTYNYNVSGQGFSLGYTLGTTDQAPISSFEKIENIIPVGGNVRLFQPPVNQGIATSVVATLNTNTYPDADSIKVSVRVPALLTQDDKGNTNGFEIKYAVDIAVAETAWVQQGEYSIIGKCTSAYVRQTIHTLPKGLPTQSNLSWRVRVRRTTNNILSIKTQNELYFESLSVISSSSLSYPTSVLVGTILDAEQFPAIPSRAYELDGAQIQVPQGYTPTVINSDGTYTSAVYPSVWNGTFDSTLKWTNNPAWILYDLITNKRYGLGKYVATQWVDKWSLYEIAQHCDEMVDNGKGGSEPRYTVNCSLQQRTEAYDLLQNIVSAFRGMMYFANGKIFATQNSDKGPVYNYTNANIVNGSFQYADTAKNTRSTVIIVRYTDPSDLYREAIERIEDQEGILRYGYIEKEVTAFACTSKGQAYRLGSWILQTERLITETITFSVGQYGNYLRPGDVFSVYDNYRFNKQQGGRIIDFSVDKTAITLDRTITLDAGFSYNLSCITPTGNLDDPNQITGSSQIPLIRNSQIQTRLLLNTPGNYSTITANAGFGIELNKGTTFIISASGDAATVADKSLLYRCLATSEGKPGTLEILGLEYSTGINYSIERSYSVQSLPANTGDGTAITPPSNFSVTPVTGLLNNNDYFAYIQLNWTGSASAVLAYYRVSGQVHGGNWINFANPQSRNTTYPVIKTGRHNFLLGAVSYGGKESTFVSGFYVVPTTNPVGGPPVVTGLSVYFNGDPNTVSPNSSGITTGYFGVQPGISWDTIYDTNGNPDPKVQFLDTYRLTAMTVGGTQISQPYIVEDPSITHFDIPTGIIYNFTGGRLRTWRFQVETSDIFGSTIVGGAINITNPAPRSPINSGFYGANGGFQYNIDPDPRDTDISGVYFWYSNDVPDLTPTFQNKSGESQSVAGFITHRMTGAYKLWYSIIDSFGVSGCPIYGPIVMRTNLGVTGIRSNDNPFIEAGVILKSTGFLNYTQDGQTITISGDILRSGHGLSIFRGSNSITISGDLLTITGNLREVTSPTTSRANINKGIINLVDAATIATDCLTGNVFQVTLGGSRILGAPTNLAAGATYIWFIDQDAGGGRALTYNTVFKFPGGTIPTLTPDTLARDTLTCAYDGTVIRAILSKDFK